MMLRKYKHKTLIRKGRNQTSISTNEHICALNCYIQRHYTEGVEFGYTNLEKCTGLRSYTSLINACTPSAVTSTDLVYRRTSCY